MILWLRMLQGIGITTLSKEEIREYERLRSRQKINKGCAHRPMSVVKKLEAESDVNALITALDDKDNSVRFSAAKALGRLKAESATRALIKALGDESDLVRSSAAEALRQIGTPPAIEALIDTDLGVKK